MPTFRPGLGDNTERYIKHPDGWGYIEYRFAPGNTCEIVNIEVDNLHRREGVGRWMLQELIKEVLSQQGCSFIYAFTRTDNRIAHEFYKGMKFKLIASLKSFYGQNTVSDDAFMFGLRVGAI